MTPEAATAPAGPTVTFPVHFRNGRDGRRRIRHGSKTVAAAVEPGRIPRISRLMALAIHFDGLIRQGVVKDYADLAKLGGVSKARISQIMALLDLCPAIQEAILLMPRTQAGRDAVTERQLRSIVREVDWSRQWEEAARMLV